MAIIYDISTGSVITASEVTQPAEHAVRSSGYIPAAEPRLATHDTAAEPPCSAYMALLQQVLRDL